MASKNERGTLVVGRLRCSTGTPGYFVVPASARTRTCPEDSSSNTETPSSFKAEALFSNMELRTLIQRILSTDRLDTIAELEAEMRAYTAEHPEETSDLHHPLFIASGSMHRMKILLLPLQEGGLPMDEFYEVRDRRDRQVLIGTPPDPWPEEWLPYLQ